MNRSVNCNRFVGVSTTVIVLVLLIITSCTEKVGVCEGYSPILHRTYCYDDWTEEECTEYDDQNVNGAEWYFHEGQTCAERGQ